MGPPRVVIVADGSDLEVRLPRPRRYELVRTLSPLRHGTGDPTIRLETGRAIRATRTPTGPATIEVRETGDELVVRSWGPGAGWAVEQAPDLLGLNDDPSALDLLAPPHRLVVELARRFAGVRLPRSGRIVEAMIPAVLEQKITGEEARQVYRSLVRVHGEPAPGPFGLRLQPTPERLAGLPYHAYHPLGLERRRAETLKRIGALAERLEAAASLPLDEAHRRLGRGPGHRPVDRRRGCPQRPGRSRRRQRRRLPPAEPGRVRAGRRAAGRRRTDARDPGALSQRGRGDPPLEASGIGAPRRGPRMARRSIAGILARMPGSDLAGLQRDKGRRSDRIGIGGAQPARQFAVDDDGRRVADTPRGCRR